MTEAEATLAALRSALRRAALRAPDLEGALVAAEVLGKLNWDNNDASLSEEALEAAIHERHGGELSASALGSPSLEVEWLHIISEAHEFGGHTRLLEMLLAAQGRADRRTAVVATRLAVDRFHDAATRAGSKLHLLEGSRAQRAAAVLGLGRAARRVVLHIHPDDAGAALAARQLRAEGRQVMFVNHADHVFSYGPGAADLCLEVSGFGWRLTEGRRAAQAQHFLGIPVEVTARMTLSAGAPSEPPEGPVFSMGAWHKYRPDGGYDFPAFVDDLLDRTQAEVEIVGPSASDPWWANTLAKHGKRVRLLGGRSFEETSARLSAAACYVDSFPMSGGTALPQALMAGKEVFGPGLGEAGGYNLAELLRFGTVAEMTDALVTFLRTGETSAQASDLRRRIAEDFNADSIADRLQSAARGDLRPPPAEILQMHRRPERYGDWWRAKGQVEFDIATAGGLPFRDRMALAWACRSGVVESRGRRTARRALPGWALRGR